MQVHSLLIARRSFVMSAAAATLLPAWASTAAKAEPPLVEVWKSPTCGCCGEWIKHLQANGFATKTHLVPDTAPVRRRVGFDEKYGSCHTAMVGGYALEGHVPAREIKRLLKEKPAGLAGHGPALVRRPQDAVRRDAGQARRHVQRVPELPLSGVGPACAGAIAAAA